MGLRDIGVGWRENVSIERRVSATLISSQYSIMRIWRGRDAAGRRAASGVYFARFEADGVVQTQSLLMVK